MPKLLDKPNNQPSLTPWLVLMFLFSLNFVSAGGYILILMMGIYLVIHLREFSFRTTEIFLFLFGTEYFLFCFLWTHSISAREICNYLTAPWLLYWMGRSMAQRRGQKDLPLRLATTLALGFFACALLSMIYSMYFSPPSAGSRLMYTFWDHTTLSVTAGGLLFTMAIGMSVGYLTTKCTFRSKLLWLSVLGGCVYYAFTWAHRTSILIIGILLVYNYLHYLFTMNIPPFRKFILFSASVLVLAIVIACLALNVGGCYTWLQGQWLYQRLTNVAAANSGSRLKIWGAFFEQWLLYPLGGKQFRITAGYVHNLWLDVYYLGGILPFAALVIATVLAGKNFLLYRKLHTEQEADPTAHILTNYYMAVFLAFMVEPVMNAYPYILLAVILVSGSIEGTITAKRPHTS